MAPSPALEWEPRRLPERGENQRTRQGRGRRLFQSENSRFKDSEKAVTKSSNASYGFVCTMQGAQDDPKAEEHREVLRPGAPGFINTLLFVYFTINQVFKKILFIYF